MSVQSYDLLQRILAVFSILLIVKVTIGIVLGYNFYLPPDFNSDFLRGREDYFYGVYCWAFYVHIISGPITLFLGLLLLSEPLRNAYPHWHRCMGRCQGLIALFLLAPSGLWMSQYASGGTAATISLALLSCLTAVAVGLGWNAALQRRFELHRRWMLRSYLMICSAVVLRLLGGLGSLLGEVPSWYDPATTWLSWLVPLIIFEIYQARNPKSKPYRKS
ncbi:DUF2306 domain-containing protein [Rubinisphaera italica]|uniref:DUF2306 domain-containing protein n=1 Tax=Rubinisphaera italica TaxID=2527969 RepID=A0A5C5XAV9_9PLAN|nr:DUF2306 domain-containing protein [Rubinisphaera italica]TWT59423.1 hypothetical protein Pan54_01290 [Rubinisphaera italica]